MKECIIDEIGSLPINNICDGPKPSKMLKKQI